MKYDPLLRSSIVCPDYSIDYPTISHGKDALLYDKDGKEYVDCAGGKAAVANIGHGVEELGEIIKDQVNKLAISPTHYFRSDELDSYLSNLLDYAGGHYSKAWTVNSGTEAVENALKLAIQYFQLKGEEGRYKILGRNGSYHGNSVYALDVGGMELRRNNLKPLMHNTYHVSEAYCYRCPFNLEPTNCALKCAASIEEMILKENPETIAAIILEPVVGAALGGVVAPEGYFAAVRQICDKYGILLIADEVMTGFARTGYNLAVDKWNATPDIVALGKGMASGYYPLSGILINDKVASQFEDSQKPFFGGHTYSCNPLGATVGQFVLDFMLQNELSQKSHEKGHYFKQRLQQVLSKHNIIGNIRGEGLLIGVEIVGDKLTKKPLNPEKNASRTICHMARENGVIFYPGSGSAGKGTGDHILITPPLVIAEEEIDRAVDILDKCIKHYTEKEKVAMSC